MIIESYDIVKRYATQIALENVNIQISQGSVHALLGPNGAGKTTLIRLLNQITLPDSGEIRFEGHPLGPGDIKDIGYLPEERGLYKKMKVSEQAVYLAQLKGLSQKEATKRLRSWFEKFDIMPWWNKKLEELSKGMQQKIQFIITVLHEPKLLIFDEPFSGFDPLNAELLKEEIQHLAAQGHTIILSSHNMHSIEEMCQYITLINHGKVMLQGELNRIKAQHRTGHYEVTLECGSLNPQSPYYTILSHNENQSASQYTLLPTTGVSNNELLTALLQQAPIRSFRERETTLHEIFLKTTQENA